MTDLQAKLLALGEEDYRIFQCRLMPTVDPGTVIGVRTPLLRKMAKEMAKAGATQDFLQALPHRYYEENNLHAFLIEQITDFDACVTALNRFLPFVDNWATCDSMNPRVLGRHKSHLLATTEAWLCSKDTYAVRFGIKMLMTWFLDDDFCPLYLDRVASIQSEQYYVNMMIAWYFATALAKQYEATLPYLQEQRLPAWIHAKTVRKAIESYRITPAQKALLRTL